jgi:hypothetical protein
MTVFLNAIINLRHPEEARSAVSKDAYFVMQRRFPTLRRLFHSLIRRYDIDIGSPHSRDNPVHPGMCWRQAREDFRQRAVGQAHKASVESPQ